MNTLTLAAPAKLNLTLDILGKRPDGYHDLQMVMQTIALSDTVTVRTAPGSGHITVHMPGSDLPTGPENIAHRAAAVFFAHIGIADVDAEITVEKRIPAQAGMAGGSTDGAAVLRALRTLLRPDLPTATLEKWGEQVGSDVPFCVRGGTALAEGRGERLTTLPSLPECHVLVCKPDFGLSTPALFGRIRLDAICRRPDTAAMTAALTTGDLPAVAGNLANVFEEVLTGRERQEIAGIEDAMKRGGALNAAMTGSGPTVFGLFDRETAAVEAAEHLRRRYAQTYLTHPL